MVTLSYRPDLGMADGRPNLVFIMADHQRVDSLGQHGTYQQNELYEQAIRVPLLIHVPGAGPRTFDSPVSHLDVMPTILALTGVTVPADLNGVSLGECVISGTLPPERLAFAQYSENSTPGDIRRAVIARRYKCRYDPDDLPELHDLENDPLEMDKLASEGRGTEGGRVAAQGRQGPGRGPTDIGWTSRDAPIADGPPLDDPGQVPIDSLTFQ